MMDVVKGDIADVNVENKYQSIIKKYSNEKIRKAERFEFYEKSKKAFLVVMTSDVAKYGNILITKGLTKKFQSKL
jgi:L-fucose mutarotase